MTSDAKEFIYSTAFMHWLKIPIMRNLVNLTLLGLALTIIMAGCRTVELETEICVYEGTSAGVISAYATHQLEKSAILIEPSAHLGSLSSDGPGATDIGNKFVVTGISRDFYRKLGDHYGQPEI